MTKPRIVIVGASFAGYTAALTLARRVTPNNAETIADVTIISDTDSFFFRPALVWLPFVHRKFENVSFPLRPPLEHAGVTLVVDRVEKFDLKQRVVITSTTTFNYDRLLIATGVQTDYEAVPGLGPNFGYTHDIFTYDEALRTRSAWDDLTKNPGPVVVGTTQHASWHGAGYKFVLNLAYQVRALGLEGRVPITYVTAEPFLGHFGLEQFETDKTLAEALFKQMNIEWRTSKIIDHVGKGEVVLSDGEHLPFSFAMIVPPFIGVDAVRDSEGLGDACGFIPADDSYRLPGTNDVFVAGVASAMATARLTKVIWGIPLSEAMARIAAYNIAAEITGVAPITIPFNEVVSQGHEATPMGQHPASVPVAPAMSVPGAEVRLAQEAFGRNFLNTRQCGWV